MQLPRNLFVHLTICAICLCIAQPTPVQEASPDANAAQSISIQVVIDTYLLEQDFENQNVSQNPKSPTAIVHKYAYMIASKPYVVSGQATADLHIKCYPQDTIIWYSSSESNNLDSSVIVYDLKNVLPNIQLSPINTIATSKIIPANPHNINDTTTVTQPYISLRGTVQKAGKIDYRVFFALYVRNRKPDNKQRLLGYFEWDPTITILSGSAVA